MYEKYGKLELPRVSLNTLITKIAVAQRMRSSDNLSYLEYLKIL